MVPTLHMGFLCSATYMLQACVDTFNKYESQVIAMAHCHSEVASSVKRQWHSGSERTRTLGESLSLRDYSQARADIGIVSHGQVCKPSTCNGG